jgi:antitoxin PrlF
MRGLSGLILAGEAFAEREGVSSEGLKVSRTGCIDGACFDGGMPVAKIVQKSPLTEDDYVRAFLDFIDKDIAANPHGLVPLSDELFRDVDELTKGVEVDMDAPLPDDEECG